MRNPERIIPLCERLAEAWKKIPDLRLGQLLVDSLGGKDPFYIEDEDLIRMIEQFVRGSTDSRQKRSEQTGVI